MVRQENTYPPRSTPELKEPVDHNLEVVIAQVRATAIALYETKVPGNPTCFDGGCYESARDISITNVVPGFKDSSAGETSGSKLPVAPRGPQVVL